MRSRILAITAGVLFCSATVFANTTEQNCVVKTTFGGRGAGEVVYDGPLHLAKGYDCSYCHENRGFALPLFEKEKGGNLVTMRRMELGWSCGHCHDGKEAFSVIDQIACSRCHQK